VATDIGFDAVSVSRLTTATSELVRNVLKYATRGDASILCQEKAGRIGIEIVVRDWGPGIPDLEAALTDHYSTSGTLGLGLPGVRRMMDDFEMQSTPGEGTVVRICHWLD
jgi:serine/threonine-protein kinase RsbT